MKNSEEQLFQALDAAVEAFKRAYRRSAGGSPGAISARPPRVRRLRDRYPQGSWKYDVLDLVEKLIGNDEERTFRFSEFEEHQGELRRRHPDHSKIMSGVAVTLQGLQKDRVVEKVARGVYRLL